jgi:carbonic anhydrase
MCISSISDFLSVQTNSNAYDPYTNQEEWKKFQNYYSVTRAPININSKKVIKTKNNNLKIKYTKSKFTIAKYGGIPYAYPIDKKNYVIFNNKKFILINYHLHNSSENTIDNVFNEVEIHFVNLHIDVESGVNEILVVSLLLNSTNKKGLEITELDYKTLSENINYETEFDMSIFNSLTKNEHYNFIGSLTVPPFTQNFNWFLFSPKLTNTICLKINKTFFDNFDFFFQNCKANEQSIYNSSRQINEKHNFLAIKLIKNE